MSSATRWFETKQSYRRVFEKALVLSLALHLLALLTWTQIAIKPYEPVFGPLTVIALENIPTTTQSRPRPPAPTRPTVPIVAESEDFPEDITIPETIPRPDAVAGPFDSGPPGGGGGAGLGGTIPYDIPPRPIKLVYPAMPKEAKKARIKGTVKLLLQVNEQGRVVAIKVFKSLGYGCTEAAVEATKRMEFIPAMRNGRPVKVWYPFTQTFDFGKRR